VKIDGREGEAWAPVIIIGTRVCQITALRSRWWEGGKSGGRRADRFIRVCLKCQVFRHGDLHPDGGDGVARLCCTTGYRRSEHKTRGQRSRDGAICVACLADLQRILYWPNI
jgi:hypothetical protein